MARIPRRQRRLALSTLLLISLFIALAVFASFARAQDGDAEEVGYASDEVDGEEQEATFEDAVEAQEDQGATTDEVVPEEPPAPPAPVPEPEPEPEPIRVLPHYAEIAVKELRARVSAADGTMGEVQKLTYPEKFAQPLTVGSTGSLKLGFKVYDAKIDDKPALAVNQAVLILSHRETKKETTFVAEASKLGTYALDIDLASATILQSIDHAAGLYDMTLVLGSFSTPSVVSYPLGSVQISLPSSTEPGYVGPAKAKTAGAGAPNPEDYVVKPEIKHVFRPDAKQAPFIVSAFFTVATVAPWAVLLFGWQQLGFTPSTLTSQFATPMQYLFVGTIAALPVLMFLYWTAWNLFQLLAYLSVWGVVAFVSGRGALREHAAWRIKNEGGKAKKSE